MTNHHTTITTVAALSFTGLAVGLAIASSLDRAPAGHAAVLLAGLSAAIVLAVHLAPALLRSVPQLILWPFWSLCLVAALWAHVGFLTATAADASAARLASSPAAAAAAQQRADLERAINQIKARPAPQVLRQMSWTTDPARTLSLQAELQDAKRRQALQDQLLALSAAASAAAATATADPVSGWLAAALGISASTVQLAAGLLLALLIEVIGMFLWMEVRASSSRPNDRAEIVQADASHNTPQPTHAAAPTAQAAVQNIVQVTVQQPEPAVQTGMHQTAQLISDAPSDEVSRLIAAVRSGQCLPTVQGIRQHLRCSQVKARELRHALDDSLIVS